MKSMKETFSHLRRRGRTVIVAFGDSLTAGDGVAKKDCFPAQLERKLRAEGFGVCVINCGVGGETTGGGLARLDKALALKPDFFILELGTNDMLRGYGLTETRENLRKIISKVQAQNIPVLLCGMETIVYMDAEQTKDHPAMFEALAKEYNVPLYPFFLNGAYGHAELMQDDALHPNAKGVAAVVENIVPEVKKLVADKTAKAPAPKLKKAI